MDKDAYLIIAHGEISGLKRLLKALDDERNDMYIHYDKKYELDDAKKKEISDCVKKSKLYFTDRIKVNWGGYSQIQCEMKLLKTVAGKNYRYLHFLSGIDYPIKSNDYIYNFFTEHNGEEFVEFWKDYKKDYLFRIKYYYPLQEKIGTYTNDLKTLTLRVIAKLYIFLQKLFRVNRAKKYDGQWKIGSNWVSITGNLANYLIKDEDKIYEMFHQCVAGDELFVQTLMYNSDFCQKNNNKKTRLIDWERGNPYIWTMKDIDEICESDCLFARKIVDEKLMDEIDKRVR